METKEAIKKMSDLSSKSMRAVSLGMGRSSTFLSTTLAKGSTPQADTLAAIAAQCGYSLALVPTSEALPPGSLVID